MSLKRKKNEKEIIKITAEIYGMIKDGKGEKKRKMKKNGKDPNLNI